MNFEFPTFDPVLLDLPGPVDIRWYGLMYIVGFVVAGWILKRLSRDRLLPLAEEQTPDFLIWLLFGVILGGRFGYALFYDQGLAHPLRIFEIWKGGMSFHGGLIGVCVAFVAFSIKHRQPLLRLGDAAALCVTPGILFVRIANFINGELYGRVTDADAPFAMRFPTDPEALRLMGLTGITDTRSKELALQVAAGHREFADVADRLTPVDSFGRQVDWNAIAPRLDWAGVQESVPYRYPSQLFEGIAEGLLLGLLMFVLYRALKPRHLGPGGYGGVFLLGYGLARFFLEYVRQPDSQFTSADDPVGTVFMGLTMGQTLSSIMIITGVMFLVRGIAGRSEAPAA